MRPKVELRQEINKRGGWSKRAGQPIIAILCVKIEELLNICFFAAEDFQMQ